MEKTKMSFKAWFENIWYHYKWVIIIGGLVVIFLLVSLVQSATTDEMDIDILHIGPMYISPEAADQLKETVGNFAYDYTGDGEVNVGILDITVNKFGDEENGIDPVNYDQNGKGYQRFQTEIRAGDSIIYLLDEPYFNICVSENLLTPLSEILDEADMPENVIDGCGVKISELDCYELAGISSIPETAILCIRRSPEKDELTYGRNMDGWECHKTAFVNMIKYSK